MKINVPQNLDSLQFGALGQNRGWGWGGGGTKIDNATRAMMKIICLSCCMRLRESSASLFAYYCLIQYKYGSHCIALL